MSNIIDLLIEERYPGQLQEIRVLIQEMSKDYDKTQFLEEDIQESILMELDII